jgi:hypothetical protein
MITCEDRYEQVCKGEFAAINTKLDRLDQAIRGNSKPGIQVRLDRLESAERTRGRLVWLLAGSVVTVAVSGVWRLVMGG